MITLPPAIQPDGDERQQRKALLADLKRSAEQLHRVHQAAQHLDIDVYIGETPEDVIGDDVWAETFTEQPAPLTAEEKKEYLSKVTGVCLGSDAFFPFGDNIERARRSGVTAIVQPGGSIRDQQVIDTCNKYGIAMAFCGIRLFHH